MGYQSRQHNQEFQPGDIICLRSTAEPTWACRLFAQAQAAIKGCDKGHKNTIHMAIVTSIDDKGNPNIAHIDEPDNNDQLPRSYQNRQVLGMPQEVALHPAYLSQNLLIIRHKTPELREAIATSASEAVAIQQSLGTSWKITGAIETFLKSMFGGRRNNEQNYAKSQMICTQFVSDSLNKARKKLGLDPEDVLDVSTELAMPKVIEHTLKTKHADDYDFFINPPLREGTFNQIVENKIMQLYGINSEIAKAISDVHEILEDNSLTDASPFDTGRILLFFAKKLLPKEQYKPLQRYLKQELGIFDEDIDFMRLKKTQEQLANFAMADIQHHLKGNESIQTAICEWKKNVIPKHEVSEELRIKINKLDESIKMCTMKLKIDKGRESFRTAAKIKSLTVFLDNFKDLSQKITSLNPEERGAYFEAKEGMLNALKEEASNISSYGHTRNLLLHALQSLDEVRETVHAESRLQHRNALT